MPFTAGDVTKKLLSNNYVTVRQRKGGSKYSKCTMYFICWKSWLSSTTEENNGAFNWPYSPLPRQFTGLSLSRNGAHELLERARHTTDTGWLLYFMNLPQGGEQALSYSNIAPDRAAGRKDTLFTGISLANLSSCQIGKKSMVPARLGPQPGIPSVPGTKKKLKGKDQQLKQICFIEFRKFYK